MATSIRRKIDMTADGCKFRGKGIAFTATAGITTTYDYKLTEGRLIEAPIILCKDHVWGDSVVMQVVDVDNILGYGANTVLDEFATDWYMDPSRTTQYIPDIWYSAEVLTNLYIRFKYTSVGATNVSVQVNLVNHKYTV